MRRGFKEHAKRLALEVRDELGLDAFTPLDPVELAAQYGIPVYALSELAPYGSATEAIAHFSGENEAAFSAALVPIRTGWLIVENDFHAPTRRRSSVAHEMAHVILEHGFALSILGFDGCRSFNREIEDEAEWFSSELLIPYKAAVALARRGTSDSEVAKYYGVSTRRAAMRMNASGARIVANRARGRRQTQD